jgi:hypothetical protein
MRVASAGAYAEPAHPIAYSELDAYLKASPRERASRDWQLAATGASVNAAAASTAPMTNDTPAAPPAPATAPTGAQTGAAVPMPQDSNAPSTQQQAPAQPQSPQ